MPTAAQEWIKQGKTEGRVEALLGSILDVLEARFGSVDDAVRTRLMGMKVEDLRPLVRRAATAPSLDAVFEDGRHH